MVGANLKALVLLLATTLLMLAQQSRTSIPSCGLGMNKDHPCQCVRHTQQVQADYMRDCITADHGETVKTCMAKMPSHCSITERYGRWSLGADGEHDNPMPDQCTQACKRSHCACDDGSRCHYAHSPDDDLPVRRGPKK